MRCAKRPPSPSCAFPPNIPSSEAWAKQNAESILSHAENLVERQGFEVPESWVGGLGTVREVRSHLPKPLAMAYALTGDILFAGKPERSSFPSATSAGKILALSVEHNQTPSYLYTVNTKTVRMGNFALQANTEATLYLEQSDLGRYRLENQGGGSIEMSLTGLPLESPAVHALDWDLLDRAIASPEDIDRAVQGSMGFRLSAMGPLEINVSDIQCDTQLPSGIQNLIDDGHFGVKTGRGIHDYTPKSIGKKRALRDRRFLVLARLLYNDA